MYLTRRQREVLDCIEAFINEHGYSPTLEEICGAMGLSSLATVHKHLQNLEAKGLLKRNWNHSRAIELTRPNDAAAGRPELPLMGEVAAGYPIEAIENPDPIEVPSTYMGAKDSYVLRVRGESMVDDGILDGDLLIVESREEARRGETVVALVDGTEATVKRFYPEGEIVRLQPANSTMAPMRYPADQVRVQGVVIGLMRQY